MGDCKEGGIVVVYMYETWIADSHLDFRSDFTPHKYLFKLSCIPTYSSNNPNVDVVGVYSIYGSGYGYHKERRKAISEGRKRAYASAH